MNPEVRIVEYITRFAPSKNRLLQYIERKWWGEPSDTLIKALEYDEQIVLRWWIQSYIYAGKGERDMLLRLLKKWFQKEMILSELDNARVDTRSWEDYRKPIQTALEQALWKGKSLQMICMELWSRYPYFRHEIDALLDRYSDRDGLEKKWEKYKKIHDITHVDGYRKCFQALLRQGFRAENIRDFLKQDQE
jgi:SOS response regulatory protein OraA/RecX